MSLRTLVPDPGTDKVAGVNWAEIRLANPLTEKAMAALKLPLTVTFKPMLSFDPATMARRLEEAVACNVGAAVAPLQWLTSTDASM
ncbi:MAG: hypothetical protein WBL22_13325, partial [Candidatus Sulfotelmatobacter sp.]